MEKKQKMVEVMIAGQKASLPQRLSGKHLREISNVNGRVVILHRGNRREIVNDTDILTLQEGDEFVDSPLYRVGNETRMD